MTKEYLQQRKDILQAYIDGKIIETLDGCGHWIEANENDIKIRLFTQMLRIKPEENYTIEQNVGENQIEGGVVSISGSVDTFRCWKCGRTLPISKRTNFVYASNPPRYSCKECEEIKKEKQYRTFKDCDELIETYQKKYKSAVGCDIYFPKLYKPAIWVRHKVLKTEHLITSYGLIKETNIEVVEVSNMNYSMKELLESWEFLDGSPIGIAE